uniref:Uncharacterized protein n=1 Tax=Knipowitschia caucasica TaxID=637954 RepID=A0AAV2ML43_KNICA
MRTYAAAPVSSKCRPSLDMAVQPAPAGIFNLDLQSLPKAETGQFVCLHHAEEVVTDSTGGEVAAWTLDQLEGYHDRAPAVLAPTSRPPALPFHPQATPVRAVRETDGNEWADLRPSADRLDHIPSKDGGDNTGSPLTGG